jgi:putative transposase
VRLGWLVLSRRRSPARPWRRFVYPAPNACWQLDATEYVLSGGRTCVIFQLIDDHSRYAVASHAASRETAKDAITVVDKDIAAQGKNERFHQTLFHYLDKQPIAESLVELQAQVDAFDHIYNTQRPHQGLPGRVTPLARPKRPQG